MKIEVPAHSNGLENFQKLTVVMHAGGIGGSAYWHNCGGCRNNMLMMTDTTCEIKDIPDDIYPVDIAMAIKEINSNSTLVAADWEERHFAHTNTTLSATIQNSLHPHFKELCQEKNYEGSVKREITKEDAELFSQEEGLYSNELVTPTCGIRVKQQFITYLKIASSRKSHTELRTRSPGCGRTTKQRARGAARRR